MAVGWFFAPYKRIDRRPGVVGRYCAMLDFDAQIVADGGAWSEAECLGDNAVVKVRATAATLQTINQAPGFLGVPGSRLNDPLSSLTAGQKTTLRNKILSLGYTTAEIQARFPNDLSTYTLGDVFRFALTRRLKPRYDIGTDTIILDGPEQPTRPVEDADAAVI